MRLGLKIGGRIGGWVAPVAMTLVATAGIFVAALYTFEADALRRAKARAAFYESTLVGALERFQHLPFILARDPVVVAAVNAEARARLNTRLEAFAKQAGLEAIYLMDTDGLTVAASNHRAGQTFLGHNYGFRPYFQQAMAGERGEFYAIGATTSRPGYFVAERVRDADGRTIGVIAVKIDLSPLQQAWRVGGERLLVSNRDGVVLLASDASRLYGALAPISDERRAAIATERQFGAEALDRLDWREDGENALLLDGERYLHAPMSIPRLGWTLHYLADRGPLVERAYLAALGGLAVLTAILLAAATVRSERLRAALRSSQSHRRELERSNRRLERAQADLARASKMAAFGQLAASVTHELGQPVSAMRNYLAAAELDATPEERAETLGRLRSIIGRMENVTRQLKLFSRPGENGGATDPRERFDLRTVVEGAILLVGHDVGEAGLDLRTELPDAPQPIVGDRLRLEQVLVNLMRNAIAAMTENDEETGDVPQSNRLTVRLGERDGAAVFEVEDDGPGIGARSIEELQEPFHTTRPSGQGMGLGLAIAAAIAENGNIQLDFKSPATERTDGFEAVVVLPPIGADK